MQYADDNFRRRGSGRRTGDVLCLKSRRQRLRTYVQPLDCHRIRCGSRGDSRRARLAKLGRSP